MEKNMSILRPCKISSINSRVWGYLGITRGYFSKPEVWGFRVLGLRGLIGTNSRNSHTHTILNASATYAPKFTCNPKCLQPDV